MRIPIILMLAIIVLTPANIHEVAWKALGQVETAIGMAHAPATQTTDVASLR